MSQAKKIVAATLRQNGSLSSYLGAVDALGRANATTAVLKPYRSHAQRLAYQYVQAGSTEPLPWVATATFALQDQNASLFQATTQQILDRFPDNPHGHYFAGVHAIEQRDWAAAERALKRAAALGLPEESIADMLRLAIDRQRWVWQYALLIGVVALVWAFGLGCLYVLGAWLSRWTFLAAQRDDPTTRNSREHRLRWLYRRVIDVASAYYFLSLPVLLVLSIALPLALAYAALMLPYVSLWVVAIVLLGGVAGVVTAVSGIRTAFVRVSEDMPGRSLSKHEAPEFWLVLEEVAQKVGTDPVDEVWVTPQTEMAVLEQGGSIARLTGRGKRALIFGVGLLPGFRVDALKAVLAHEYAHFLHGDTAGGDVALRVRAAMHRHADAIAGRGVVRPWDIAIWYLKLYYRLFGELTHGASRLQEVLADRRAVECYGGRAFASGLDHVVRRGVEFDTLINEALRCATRPDEPAVAFYAPSKALTSAQNDAVKGQVRDAYQLPELPSDSHPSLGKRYAAARLSSSDRPVGPESVTKLFGATASRLAREMLRELTGGIEREAHVAKAENQHALKKVESIIDRDPSFELIETRAVLHFRNGDHELALDDLDLLLEVLPNDLKTLLSRSHLFEVMGDDQRMVQDLLRLRKHAAHLPKTEQLSVAIRLGAVLAKHGKHEQAAKAYEEAVSIAPESANAILGRLKAAEKTGELAIYAMGELVERLASLCPQEPELARLARAAGVTLDAEAIAASVASPTRAPAIGAAKSLLALGTLATAASLGIAAAYLCWPRTTPLVALPSEPDSSEQDLKSLIESALPAIPDAKPPGLDVSTPSARQPRERASLLASDRRVGTASSDQASPGPSIEDPDPSDDSPDPDSLANGDPEPEPEPEPEPDTLSPREIQRRASERLQQIGRAFRAREREEGILLSSQADQTLSWRVHLLPHLGLQELHRQFDPEKRWDEAPNRALIDQVPEVYRLECEPGQTRMRVLVGERLLVRPGASTESRFAIDGAETTALAYFVGRDRQTPWTRPDTDAFDLDQPLDSLGITSGDPFVALMANGTVRPFDSGLHPKKLVALATAQGSEPIHSRQWLSPSQANQPPPRVIVAPMRADGKPETEAFVRLPRVRAPRSARRSGGRTTPDPIEERLRKIGYALHAYHDAYGSFPVAPRSPNRGSDGEPMLSWRVHVLPFLDQRQLYERFRLDEPWDSEHNLELARLMPAVYASDQKSSAKTRFVGLSGPHQLFEGGGGITFRRIIDGTANTLAVVHAGRDKAVPWTKPADLKLDLQRPALSLGRVGEPIACLRADARVMRLPRKLPSDAWAALATYSGRELIDGETIRRLGAHTAGKPITSGVPVPQFEKRCLQSIVLAMHNYADTAGAFPADIMVRNEEDEFVPTLSWRVRLLPYLEQGALFRQFRRDEPWDSDHNRKLIDYMPDVFRDADDPADETRTRIQVLTGSGTPYETAHRSGKGPRRRDFTDGVSNTILAMQADPRRAVVWTQPADIYFDPGNLPQTFGRADPQYGRLVTLADGSVHTLPHRTPLQTLAALSTPRGGEIIDDSWRYGN